jgi:hypothetical protein
VPPCLGHPAVTTAPVNPYPLPGALAPDNPRPSGILCHWELQRVRICVAFWHKLLPFRVGMVPAVGNFGLKCDLARVPSVTPPVLPVMCRSRKCYGIKLSVHHPPMGGQHALRNPCNHAIKRLSTTKTF